MFPFSAVNRCTGKTCSRKYKQDNPQRKVTVIACFRAVYAISFAARFQTVCALSFAALGVARCEDRDGLSLQRSAAHCAGIGHDTSGSFGCGSSHLAARRWYGQP